MVSFGHVVEFNEAEESTADYRDRFEALVNNIPDANKASLLCSVMGARAYKLLKTLVSPEKPATKTYNELIATLQNYYSPKPLIIAERYKFWKAKQQESQSVAEYIVKLKELAASCNFGRFYDEALRDRLVSGLNTAMSRTQAHLLTVDTLTFDGAVKKCLADEMAGRACVSETVRYSDACS
ncbi:Uncharacterised protein r2_g2440 [Pycnogonum litorale]